MRRFRMSSVAALAAVAAVAVVLGACGGGGGGDGGGGSSFEGQTVESADGVLTVEVPEGAAAGGVEVTITALSEEDLPSELQNADVVVVAYELGPDGAEFAEPLAVTFRVDPDELGLDLPERGVPLGALLTTNAAGEFERIDGAVLSREDGMVVARGTMAHFTPAFLLVSPSVSASMDPQELSLVVGTVATASVVVLDLSSLQEMRPDQIAYEFSESEWGAAAPFSATRTGDAKASISCSDPTKGKVEDAYRIVVPPEERDDDDLDPDKITISVFEGLDLFGQRLAASLKLAGVGTCTGDEETTGGDSTDGGGSSVEVNGANAAGESSGDIAGAVGGCEDGNSKEAECVPHVDITGVSWGPVEGSPGLMEVSVTLGGMPPADSSSDYNVTIKGSGTARVQERLRGLGGELSCETFRGGLEGETCETPAPDRFVIRVDISGLTYLLEIELFSMQNTTDGRIGDHYVVENIGQP